VHLFGRPPRHPNDGKKGRNRSIFSGDVGVRLQHQEVERYFISKGRRLVYDQMIGLWIDPEANKG
jgi:hypothetical protein